MMTTQHPQFRTRAEVHDYIASCLHPSTSTTASYHDTNCTITPSSYFVAPLLRGRYLGSVRTTDDRLSQAGNIRFVIRTIDPPAAVANGDAGSGTPASSASLTHYHRLSGSVTLFHARGNIEVKVEGEYQPALPTKQIHEGQSNSHETKQDEEKENVKESNISTSSSKENPNLTTKKDTPLCPGEFRIWCNSDELTNRMSFVKLPLATSWKKFFLSLAHSRFRVEWVPNTLPLNYYGQGKLIIKGENLSPPDEKKVAKEEPKPKPSVFSSNPTPAPTSTTTVAAPTIPYLEYATYNLQLDMPSLYSQLQDGECPILRHGVSTLAMMCRYLKAGDLIAVYKTSRLLSQAASHSIVHQSSQSVCVDLTPISLGFPPRSYVSDGGITCTFTQINRMRDAFTIGKLLQQTRILRIRTNVGYLTPWIECLIEKGFHTPALRALRIEAPETPDALSPADGGVVLIDTDISDRFAICPAFSYLRLVHLTMSIAFIEMLLPYLPRSMELLHCSITNQYSMTLGRTSNIPRNLIEVLKYHPMSRFLFHACLTSAACEDLVKIGEIEELKESHQVDYCIPIYLSDTIGKAGWKSPHRPLRLGWFRMEVQIDLEPEYLVTYLEQFGALSSLSLVLVVGRDLSSGAAQNVTQGALAAQHPDQVQVSLDPLLQNAAPNKISAWPQSVVNTLRTLHIKSAGYLRSIMRLLGNTCFPGLESLTLRHAGESIPNVRLKALFAMFPNVTELNIQEILVQEEQVPFFQALTHLKKLHWVWPSRVVMEKVQPPAKEMQNLAQHFPALTTMEVFYGLTTASQLKSLLSLETLQFFKWYSTTSWVHTREAIEEIVNHRIATLGKKQAQDATAAAAAATTIAAGSTMLLPATPFQLDNVIPASSPSPKTANASSSAFSSSFSFSDAMQNLSFGTSSTPAVANLSAFASNPSSASTLTFNFGTASAPISPIALSAANPFSSFGVTPATSSSDSASSSSSSARASFVLPSSTNFADPAAALSSFIFSSPYEGEAFSVVGDTTAGSFKAKTTATKGRKSGGKR